MTFNHRRKSMCVVCVDTEAETELELEPTSTWSPKQLARVADKVRIESLETNRRRLDPWPICESCEGPIHPTERETIYPREHSNCGLGHLERLFWKLVKARGRRRRRHALKRIARFARTGR
jgi:hypothetical protein